MKSNKKVVIIQPFLSYGGAEAVSIGIARYLNKVGFDAKLIALFLARKGIKDIDKINIVLAPSWWGNMLLKNRFLLFVLGFPILFYLVLRESKNSSLLNAHNFPTLWIAVIVGKIRNIPVFWTAHNFPQSSLDFLNIIFAKYCQKIIAVSPKVKNQIYEKYKLDSEVSYPGIDFEFFSKGKRKKLSNKKTALLVTRLRGNKNLTMAIKAVRDKDVDLLVVGEGNSKFESTGNVKFLGYKNSLELRDLYASVDFLILPAYKTEGFNLVPFEAGCLDTPSIVIKGSGADEVIKKFNLGIVSDPGIKSLSNAIDQMIKFPSKYKIKNWVKKNLNYSNYNIYA